MSVCRWLQSAQVQAAFYYFCLPTDPFSVRQAHTEAAFAHMRLLCVLFLPNCDSVDLRLFFCLKLLQFLFVGLKAQPVHVLSVSLGNLAHAIKELRRDRWVAHL